MRILPAVNGGGHCHPFLAALLFAHGSLICSVTLFAFEQPLVLTVYETSPDPLLRAQVRLPVPSSGMGLQTERSLME